MKREKQYQWRMIKNAKFKLVLMMFCLVMMIVAIGIFLNYHLFVIQKIERLDKIRDYSKYRVSLEFLNGTCILNDQLIYENVEERFYLSCLKDVQIYYDSTSSSLAYALEKGYLNSDLLTKDLYEEYGNGYVKYSNRSTDKKEQYVIYKFERENDKTDYYIGAL